MGRGALPVRSSAAFAHARGVRAGQADVVLVVGTPLDFRVGYGRPPTFAEDAAVQIDRDPAELGQEPPARRRHRSATSARSCDQLGAALPAGLQRALRRPGGAELGDRGDEGARRALEAQCASDDVPITTIAWAADIARHVTPDTHRRR